MQRREQLLVVLGGASVWQTPQIMHSMTTAPRRRWPFVLLLLASLAWLGLVAGTAAGAAWFVPEGSGLAGPAVALGYGVLGLLAGVTVGAVLGWKAGHGLLRATAAVAVVLALLTVGAVVWRVVAAQEERSGGVPLPPPAGFRLESRVAESDEMLRYRELTIDGDTWTATWIAVGPEAATCTAKLRFVEADALLRKRIEVQQALDRLTALCWVPKFHATHVYALRETDPGAPSWEVFAVEQCLQEHGEIAVLHVLLGRIPIDAVSHGRAAWGAEGIQL